MGKDKKISVSIFLFAILFSILFLNGQNVSAAVKAEKTEVKITIINRNLDKNLQELVYYITNSNDKSIQIKQITVEKRTAGNWKELERKKGAERKEKYNISSGEIKYDSMVLEQYYRIDEQGLEYGKYRIKIKYRYQGKTYEKTKMFRITQEHSKPITDDSKYEFSEPGNAEQETAKNPSASVPNNAASTDVVVKMQDFSISDSGKAKALIYYETSYIYRNTDKIVIKIRIQKKKGRQWKRYKYYRIQKRSNVIYANKELQIKNSGTYRMKAVVYRYRGNQFIGRKKMKTITVHYKKRR